MNLGLKLTMLRNSSTSIMRTLHTSTPSMCMAPKIEKSLNQVTLLGRVGADPQTRGSEDHPVVTFSLATNYIIKSMNGDLQKTDWHRVSVFRPTLRDIVTNYVRKGQRVYITGKISYGEIKTDDGQVKTATTVIADDVILFQANVDSNKPEY